MDMSNGEMILTSLGFFKNDHKLDNFRSNFGYDWTDEDLNEAIEAAGYDLTSVRNCLVEILWLKVVDEFENKGCEREKFDCWVNGSLDTHFYFKQTEVNSIDEIEELASL
ncbi:hypothetical protein HMPREF0971_01506 [Segatella oris F0302]|uniref:Myo-inositol 2-dehydrogenase n=2 Tax=Segatella oris TaxID=28135 RepID=D1QRA3_9BACT|nr:hypothetical protein HMPREF0971_01506 [Segatella oris F0302]